MRMKEANWPAEQVRRPPRIIQVLAVGIREAKRENNRLKQAEKVRDLPDPFNTDSKGSPRPVTAAQQE